MPYADPERNKQQCRIYRALHKDTLDQKRKAWYAENAERLRAEKRQYRLDHPERTRASQRQTYQRHHARIRQEANARYATHRVEIAARRRALYLVHRDKILAYNKEARKKNLPLRLALNAKRRAQLRSAPVNDLTRGQWEDIKRAYQHRCAYCQQRPTRLTQDHLTPLIKGGSHTVWNVVPACSLAVIHGRKIVQCCVLYSRFY